MWATLSLSELRPADRASFSHRPAVSSLVQLVLFILFNPTKSLGLFPDLDLVFSWSILIIHFITACSRSIPMIWTKAVPFLLKRLCPMSSSRNGDMTHMLIVFCGAIDAVFVYVVLYILDVIVVGPLGLVVSYWLLYYDMEIIIIISVVLYYYYFIFAFILFRECWVWQNISVHIVTWCSNVYTFSNFSIYSFSFTSK